MCKQDVEMARKTQPGNAYVESPFFEGTRRLAANSNRFSLMVAIIDDFPLTENVCDLVYTKFNNSVYPLAVLNNDNMSVILNIKDVGVALTGDIWVLAAGDTTPNNLFVAESQFIQELKDV